MMQVRILLMCALGEDVADRELDYWSSGRCEKRCVSFILRETFHGLIRRMAHPHCFFFGRVAAGNFILPYERDLKANSLILREFISTIVERRRAEIAADPRLR